jgi:anaerobic selenocysteine-containing dehydrogenase
LDSSTDRIADPWGPRTPYAPGAPWSARTDTHLAEGVAEEDAERWVRSASILHSNGDALDIAVRDGRIVGVRGRAVDRVNRGRLGPKDLYGWQANHSPDRLTRPLVRENGRLTEAVLERPLHVRRGHAHEPAWSYVKTKSCRSGHDAPP